MVEEIEKLQADAQHTIFPMRDLRVFHNCEVHVEVAWSAKTVAALRKSDEPTITHAGCTQMPGIESRLTTCLKEQCAGIR